MIWYELIGFVAAFFTISATLPQIIKIIRTKHTKDISLTFILMIVIGLSLWMTYGILVDSISLMVANFIAILLWLTILVYKLKYR